MTTPDSNGNGDDPTDTPPPTIYGEEIDPMHCLVMIYADAWIPYARLAHPLGGAIPGLGPFWAENPYHHEFRGDVRKEPRLFGPSRMFSWALVDMDDQVLLASAHGVGETVGFYHELVPVAGTSGGLFGGPLKRIVEKSDRATASTSEMEETLTIEGPTVVVEFEAEAHNPLIPALFAPEIDYNFEIRLTLQSAGTVAYRISGNHDGFPAYSIFLNAQNVYWHDPRPEGEDQGVFSLFSLPFGMSGEFSPDVQGVINCITAVDLSDLAQR